MNNVNLMGRLTRDPEARTTQSGQSVASFTLAVDRSTKGPKGEKETDFINCVAFGKTAEVVCTYVSKGQRLIVQGRIQTGSYTDKMAINATRQTFLSALLNLSRRRNVMISVLWIPLETGGRNHPGKLNRCSSMKKFRFKEAIQ